MMRIFCFCLSSPFPCPGFPLLFPFLLLFLLPLFPLLTIVCHFSSFAPFSLSLYCYIYYSSSSCSPSSLFSFVIVVFPATTAPGTAPPRPYTRDAFLACYPGSRDCCHISNHSRPSILSIPPNVSLVFTLAGCTHWHSTSLSLSLSLSHRHTHRSIYLLSCLCSLSSILI